MIYRNKYHLMRVMQFVSFVAALVGLQKMATSNVIAGAIILFASAIVGLFASIGAHYYWIRQDSATQAQKIELETLARLAQKQTGKHDDSKVQRNGS